VAPSMADRGGGEDRRPEGADPVPAAPAGPVPSFCRICFNACPILVEVEAGRAVRVIGDRAGPVHGGYTCVKGRAQPSMLRHPQRLLRSLHRSADGTLVPVPVEQAMDEIAGALASIVDRHGPAAVAGYAGTNAVATVLGAPFLDAFMDALGSPMRFTPATIDKPGKFIARALHGTWMAPGQGFDDPRVILMLGINPLVTYTGLPGGNPRRWLDRALRRGMQLVVIDPRRSDVARRATVHLQPRPGTDAAIVAALIRVVLDERLHDADFVRDNADNQDALRGAVERFSPGAVAAYAGVPAEDIVAAARIFARAGRGYAVAGTGANMSGHGTLVEYLLLCLETLCGHWLRAGEQVRHPGVLLPAAAPRAQAMPPRPIGEEGHRLRVRGLGNTPAGLPTAALAEEILLEGAGQVRALLSVGGNPAVAWPNQAKVADALRSLELLVQVDPWLSQTARLATHVIAPVMPLEVPSTTVWADYASSLGGGYGMGEPLAQYTPAAVERPPGSELVEEWELFYGLAQRMGLRLELTRQLAVYVEAAPGETDRRVALDMHVKPATEELLSLLSAGSRIPLDEVRRHPHGAVFAEPPVHVAPKQAGWAGRLQLGDATMLADLAAVAAQLSARPPAALGRFPFRLLCRREDHSYNSAHDNAATGRAPLYNPAFMHPDDLAELGVAAGDVVRIASASGAIGAVVAADATLLRRTVSMAFGYGDVPGAVGDVRSVGSSPSRLLDDSVEYDRYSGQPLMSNVPVAVTASPRRTSRPAPPGPGSDAARRPAQRRGRATPPW
jgi:anaerobic selenocysteine-containing dehydrogenase